MLSAPAAARPPREPGTVSVVVTVLNDPRVERTLRSLLEQRRPPTEILVDDGGGGEGVRRIAERLAAEDPRVIHLDAPGNIPESRNLALQKARGEFVAFLDADEVAPPGWLEALLAPFVDRSIGFTGGPTPALPGSARTIGARFYDGYLRRFYDVEARAHVHALPMGNSAWRAEVFDRVGLLDTSLYRKAASEDQEVALRALAAGYRGVYVPEAWVGHDFSDLSTRSLLRKQRIYAEGGYVVWRRAKSTYEASPARLAPYLLGPALLVLGAVFVIFPPLRLAGELAALGGVLVLSGLALGLTASGIRLDRKYPGLRWRVLEIPRRWATVWGAFQGWRHHGWSGRTPADRR
ncbi:MAG: glycosyltransferase [Thermoplasmata archaeon]|nr:glycosyltransferase [Thermoplasmata archaeon]